MTPWGDPCLGVTPCNAALDPETQTTRMGFRLHSGGCTRVVKGTNRFGRHPQPSPSQSDVICAFFSQSAQRFESVLTTRHLESHLFSNTAITTTRPHGNEPMLDPAPPHTDTHRAHLTITGTATCYAHAPPTPGKNHQLPRGPLAGLF